MRSLVRSYRASGDFVRFRVGHRVEDPGYFLGDEPVEFGLEQVLVDLYDGVVGHGPRPVFALAVLLVWRLKIVHRTRAMPASTSQRRAKLKVRRNPDVVRPRYRQKHKPHGRELISMSWMGETLSDILCTTGYTRDVAHMSVL